jgi:ATP-dependent Clp protease ATP-binding subunit ClpA
LATYLLAPASPEELLSQIKNDRAHSLPLAADAEPQLSNAAKNILLVSSQLADHSGDKPVGNEHLLLGLLNATNSYTAQLLVRKGVSSQSIEKLIANLRKNPSLVTKTDRHRFIPKISWIKGEN